MDSLQVFVQNDKVLCSIEDKELKASSIFDHNDEVLSHIGVGWDDDPPGIGSGRYPHGSGETPYQHDVGIRGTVARLRKQGYSESQIALALGYTSDRDSTKASPSKLHAALAIEKTEQERQDIPRAHKMFYEDKMSKTDIAKVLGVSEGTIRNWLKEDYNLDSDRYVRVANALKAEVDKKRYLDIGPGIEYDMGGVSKNSIDTAVQILKRQGYEVHSVKVDQLTNPNQQTTMTVLGAPGTTWKEVKDDPSKIQTVQSYLQDDGRTVLGLQPIKSIDSKRIFVRYTDQNGKGGREQDGIIELRRGVPDLSLNGSLYAQVRIGVDGHSYMKGMAVYSDDVPEGYDVIYNSNKTEDVPLFKTPGYDDSVFKKMKTKTVNGVEVIDEDNPFGATIKRLSQGGQHYYTDQNGNQQLSAINKVNDQGDWLKWSKTISPQVLAKQPPKLAERQLNLTLDDKYREFNEIMNLDNPVVRENLLMSFADNMDSASCHLKAKAFPRQASYVVIADPTLKDDEIFAPNYDQGEWIAAIRYPHAGPFESPKLRVNNHNESCLKRLGSNPPDAICVNAKVLEQLSGADSDGDTVVIVPLKETQFVTKPPLAGLKGFDTNIYKLPESAPGINPKTKQREMGKATNLIQDMQEAGATEDEIVRAVKHSMVVIDAEKHHLDYKASERDNGIQELKNIYEKKPGGGKGGGPATLITRANKEYSKPVRKPGKIEWVDENGKVHKDYGIDSRTGEKIWEYPDKTYEKITIGGESLKKVYHMKDLDKMGVSAEDIAREVYNLKNPDEKTLKKKAAKVESILNGTAPVKSKTVTKTEDIRGMLTVEDARELMSNPNQPYAIEDVYAKYANSLKDLAKQARKEAVAIERQKVDKEAQVKYADAIKSIDDKIAVAIKYSVREREALRVGTARYRAAVAANPRIKYDDEHNKRLKQQCMSGARQDTHTERPATTISEYEAEAIKARAISDTKLKQFLTYVSDDEVRRAFAPRGDSRINDTVKSRIRALASSGLTNAEISERLGVSASSISRILNSNGE